MMNPIQAVGVCLRKYFDFSGRASRSEFWWFTLMAGVPPWFIAAFADPEIIIGPVGWIYHFAILCPSLAVLTRRLHDSGRSGWHVFVYASLLPILILDEVGIAAGVAMLILIPYSILQLVWCIFPSNPSENEYGSPPFGYHDGHNVDGDSSSIQAPQPESGDTKNDIVQNRGESTPKIAGEEEIRAVYAYGLEVIRGDMTQSDACAKLRSEYNLNPDSAIDYITALKNMVKGEIYNRGIGAPATKIFFENIRDDFGGEGLRNAIFATRAYMGYYAQLPNGGSLYSIGKLCDEYEEKLLR